MLTQEAAWKDSPLQKESNPRERTAWAIEDSIYLEIEAKDRPGWQQRGWQDGYTTV